ncbi:hypothetical protein A0H81_14844 [Grifola frondosa]|uniref:Uncharacterized protein n=1 Tax=Grifola frondosa TaxID=5627 RepID=A0A1C7LKA3_GRIFR|nr:hypothetical protein A0H81_14844 [Grifola frondosa]
MAELRTDTLQRVATCQQELLSLWATYNATAADWKATKRELRVQVAHAGGGLGLERAVSGLELRLKDKLYTAIAHKTSEITKLVVEASQNMRVGVESRTSVFQSRIDSEIDTFLGHITAYEDALEKMKECVW